MERSKRQVTVVICSLMNQLHPRSAPHARLITLVGDRPGNDHRYSINATLIGSKLGWPTRV